ncbi:hypothetical protein [Nocardia seriolae]|uniref:Uncharacterized protein n=2 Tax=Nocardia seriolae TaxID=37332 RepID=A0ABC8B5N2_9NOCA|nr:hypothetical protein [Nocardia seriolae]APB01724.1 hypothetical protein NS506_07705 [Nocardia seriolae]MTJ76538.1 hypothetical protein [Nocardia seriolae]MTJ91042.1 hypothetical protein [Nocardia seriolae]MTK35004.1 hypothetical protein [Nocardia seriolae]MTK51620.1 hypothetical protein [Nocardia seriolae]
MAYDQEELETLVRRHTAYATRLSVEQFPSGAVDVEIWLNDHLGVIQGKDNEWGASVERPAEEKFMGHTQVFRSLEDALIAVRSLLIDAPAADELN